MQAAATGLPALGTVKREDANAPGGWWGDCSAGCRHYLVLADVGEQRLSMDWGICTNQRSHRCGLLTFEHQGCPAFEYDEEEGARLEDEYEARRAEALKGRQTKDD
jgi:hypothetical protein